MNFVMLMFTDRVLRSTVEYDIIKSFFFLAFCSRDKFLRDLGTAILAESFRLANLS